MRSTGQSPLYSRPLCLSAVGLFFAIILLLWATSSASGIVRTTSTILAGDESLRYAKQWNIPSGEVRMHVEDSIHYHVHDETVGALEFAQLLPPSQRYILHFPDDPQTYTVAMFHQLWCLDLIRERYVHPKNDTIMGHLNHCLNYLRQSILCESSVRLESVRKHNPPKVVELTGEYRCRDWTKLYAAAEAE